MHCAQHDGKAYRIVLIDCQMPGVDGFTLADSIRRSPLLTTSLIMMLTSDDRSEDTTRCRKLGINCYLIKPVRKSELLNAILAVLDGPSCNAQPLVTRLALPETQPALRVLVAEDNAVNQAFLRRSLEKLGHIPISAVNGKEAVERFCQDHLDFIFMDVQMPEMDGFSATAAIRAEEQKTGKHITIFALTAHALAGDRERCLAAGMDGYISKPAKMADIQNALQQVRHETGETTSGESEDATSPTWNRAAALERVGGDAALLDELIQIFFQEYPELAERLHEALENGDLRSVREPAHTLKGALGYLCLPEIAELAQRIEKASRSDDSRGLAELVERLTSSIDGVRSSMQPSLPETIHELAAC
jgi:CheY-like chemotaxis protein/HPt (histidine-containing phosphotransfer) domain-containing protein